MSDPLTYISAYPPSLQHQIADMIEKQTLGQYLLNRYPKPHNIANDKALRVYVMDLKNRYLKKSDPLSKIQYDGKIHVINHALGLHSYVTRIQGSKLKSKNEIRISNIFKKVPEVMLRMIVIHELAHLKEKQHNKEFYRLCQNMLADYHQIELDVRLLLIHIDTQGDLYK